ncbi:MAG: alpha/beta fold hydrolase [Anaerolineales bacterium]
MGIPALDFGGQGKPLVFLHANGYPPACYRPLLDELAQRFRVYAPLLRPLWPGESPNSLQDWHPLSRDLLRYLEENGLDGVIGVGHSMGAIALLRAALWQPERFQALVLLDPVLFLPSFMLFWNLVRALGLGYRLHPLIPLALRRRRTFDDLEKVFQAYRRRSLFRYFSDEALRTYIHGIVQPGANGTYTLAYSPEWEARIYYTGVWRDWDIWRKLPALHVPTLILRGAETDTFLERTARYVQRRAPQVRIETLEKSTHLLPLERPQAVAQRMFDSRIV